MSKRDYEERKQARIDRYKELASKNEKLALDLHEQAHKMAEAIPFGQPIMIGHHSEKSDRNYRNKIHNKFGKAFETLDKSKYYEEKANAAENNNAISSDDPDAIQKLKIKIENAEKFQTLMKKVNKIIRDKKLSREQKIEEIIKCGLPENIALKLFEPDCFGDIGFPKYKITNNNSNIHRMKERLKVLESHKDDVTSEIVIKNVKIRDNVEENRVQIFFNFIPAEEIRSSLKSHGFKWSKYNKCWQRMRSKYALDFARDLLENLKI
jgi:hypothetical protein